MASLGGRWRTWIGGRRPALGSGRGGRRLLILALLFEGSGGVLGGEGGRWFDRGRRWFGRTGGRWFGRGGGQVGGGYGSRRRRGWRASRHRTGRSRGGWRRGGVEGWRHLLTGRLGLPYRSLDCSADGGWRGRQPLQQGGELDVLLLPDRPELAGHLGDVGAVHPRLLDRPGGGHHRAVDRPDGVRDLGVHPQLNELVEFLQALVGDPDALAGLAGWGPLHRGQAGLLDGQLEWVHGLAGQGRRRGHGGGGEDQGGGQHDRGHPAAPTADRAAHRQRHDRGGVIQDPRQVPVGDLGVELVSGQLDPEGVGRLHQWHKLIGQLN